MKEKLGLGHWLRPVTAFLLSLLSGKLQNTEIESLIKACSR